ncbi:MAG: DUF1735 domain-containing protein [Polaribacter sp.]|uniref:DUF1735 domain-containing protein n=1 Tax=Polaribacter sp. TaxID=1920175 RepID=UPI003263A2AA
MKNIIKKITLIIAIFTLAISCTETEDNFEALTSKLDLNAASKYYVQFTNAAQTSETGVALTGDLVEIETTVAVTLMGAPKNEDISVDFALDPSSTLSSDMFTLSANSITIPAGETSGSVDFSTIAENMPVGETVNFILNLDAGENNSPNSNGTVLNYTLKRIEFCPLTNGSVDFEGSWSVTTDVNTGSTGNPAWFTEVNFTTVANGTDKLDVSGLGESFIAGFWGEPVVSGGTFTMDIAPNGVVTIPRQYIYTTTYSGTNYDYEIEGTGTWTNCGDKPTLTIAYDIYYPGASEGLAQTYASYLNGPSLGGTFTLN